MTTTDAAEPGSPEGPGSAALELPRPPGLFRRWIDRHPRTVDTLIAVFTAGVPALLSPVLLVTGETLAAIVVGVGSAALFVGTLFRRRVPFLLLAAAGLIAYLPTSGMGLGMISTWVALYSIAVFRSARQAWIGFGIATVLWFGIFTLDGRVALMTSDAVLTGIGWLQLLGYLVQASIVMLVPTLIGLWVGGRRRYERALIARAEDLARERDQRARLAVGEERTRIAREMHDIVSHSLTVMITLSEGAAAQAETGSDLAPDAMRRVAETGRESLAEMRRLLGVLRTPGSAAELAPQPGADGIGSLIAQFRDAGMPVTWRGEGEPIPPGSVSLAAYRIVQESLTNVLRHAPGTRRVDVVSRNADGVITLTIDNDTTHDPAPSDGSGRGLVGMRERAALTGGSLDAGPRPDGRWRVTAVLDIVGES
ncbi:MAG TPA: two-component sensor histidine kinase [Candidatus Microbacterium stercoravium]|uniref:histidine kinase n=1 Tax=Candidatus Microbacterium stercoravium TaxID=2838697 RepID=A0A9D2KGU5_9MICO|nr:two-component sensor histidine kinase [Candidatus Microbacterium stercoravium]